MRIRSENQRLASVLGALGALGVLYRLLHFRWSPDATLRGDLHERQTMRTQPTTAEIARRWELWAEYVDPYGVMSREEWEEMAVSDREALIVETFGPDDEV